MCISASLPRGPFLSSRLSFVARGFRAAARISLSVEMWPCRFGAGPLGPALHHTSLEGVIALLQSEFFCLTVCPRADFLGRVFFRGHSPACLAPCDVSWSQSECLCLPALPCALVSWCRWVQSECLSPFLLGTVLWYVGAAAASFPAPVTLACKVPEV